MSRIRQFFLTLILILISASFVSAQEGAKGNEVLLTVGGKVEHPLSLTRADFENFKRQVVSAKARDGKEHKYEGVAVADILQKAGIQFGEAIHQETAATYLLAEAVDGYRVIFALPEFESVTNDRMILIIDRLDGSPLPPAAGPLQIIAIGDKGHGRWVRQVKALTLAVAPATK